MVTSLRFASVFIVWCALSLFAVTPAPAALIVVGTVTYDGQTCKLIYDEEQNITWLDYTRPGAIYTTQSTWVQDLSLTIGGVTYDDWRLPRVTDTVNASIPPTPVSDAQKNSSEMAFLYYIQLGGAFSDPPPPGPGLPSYTPFEHILNTNYWSATASGTQFHWVLYFQDGRQQLNANNGSVSALAVYDGRVVPLPGSALLLGSGLIGLLALGGRRRKTR
jgi:hypothetical protein